jgi:hypothetical protein
MEGGSKIPVSVQRFALKEGGHSAAGRCQTVWGSVACSSAGLAPAPFGLTSGAGRGVGRRRVVAPGAGRARLAPGESGPPRLGRIVEPVGSRAATRAAPWIPAPALFPGLEFVLQGREAPLQLQVHDGPARQPRCARPARRGFAGLLVEAVEDQGRRVADVAEPSHRGTPPAYLVPDIRALFAPRRPLRREQQYHRALLAIRSAFSPLYIVHPTGGAPPQR